MRLIGWESPQQAQADYTSVLDGGSGAHRSTGAAESCDVRTRSGNRLACEAVHEGVRSHPIGNTTIHHRSMSIQPHRIAFVLDRVEKSWDASLAGLVARTIHPFDDQPAPPRRLEKAIRKRLSRARCRVKAGLTGTAKELSLSRDAVVDYITLHGKPVPTYFVNQWSTLLSEFDRHMRERADASTLTTCCRNRPTNVSRPRILPRECRTHAKSNPCRRRATSQLPSTTTILATTRIWMRRTTPGSFSATFAAYERTHTSANLADQGDPARQPARPPTLHSRSPRVQYLLLWLCRRCARCLADGTDLDPDRSPRYVRSSAMPT